jgi:hypothetical protein
LAENHPIGNPGVRAVKLRLSMVLAAVSLLAAVQACPAEGPGAEAWTFLPVGDAFLPLVGDPKQPRFSMAYVHLEAPGRYSNYADVSLGENIGLLRWTPDPGSREGWTTQLSVAAAVFAQFDTETPSSDLINADYTFGFPLAIHRGPWESRVRIYHQSSHLGDEYLLNRHPERVNLSFESVEALFGWNVPSARILGGGEYIFHREPATLRPVMLHGELELRPLGEFRIKGLGTACWVSALNVKSWEEAKWAPAWSVKSGLELGGRDLGRERARKWSLLFEFYDGFSPYGQFFDERIRYWGFGIQFTL